MIPSSKGKGSNAPPSQVLVAYGLFLFGAGAMWHLVADNEFSSILTISVMLQCLALALLALQILVTGSAAGLSAKALFLDGLALCFRLSSTLWLNGYLPVDASGDYVFQAVDVISIAIIAWLLHQLLVEKRQTYQAEEDSLPIAPMVVASLILAALLHGNMNRRVCTSVVLTLQSANLRHAVDGWPLRQHGCSFAAVVVGHSDWWQSRGSYESPHRSDGCRQSFERTLHVARPRRHHMCPMGRRIQPRDLGYTWCSCFAHDSLGRLHLLLHQGAYRTRLGLPPRDHGELRSLIDG